MLNEEQLAEVKNEFIALLRGIKRDGCDIDGLIGWMESHGFFEAPATSKYFCSFEGGLALHSINVYKTMCRFAKAFASKKEVVKPATIDEKGQIVEAIEETKYRYNQDTLLIVGLLHGISKASLYEKCSRNEKTYSKYGKSKDAIGHFDWTSTLGYKVVDENDRDIYGDNGFSSYFIISNFIPLTVEESVVLANFNELMSDEANKASMYQILSKYPLASILLASSIIASYCIENPKMLEFENQKK